MDISINFMNQGLFVTKNRRQRQKYPALNINMNIKRRQHLIDYDYINKLSEEEKEWLNKFTEEYVNASFDKKKTPLHNTSDLKKDCYRRNNKRNRDLYLLLQIKNELLSTTGFDEISVEPRVKPEGPKRKKRTKKDTITDDKVDVNSSIIENIEQFEE